MKGIVTVKGRRIDLRVWRRVRRSDVIGVLGMLAVLLWAWGVVRKWW